MEHHNNKRQRNLTSYVMDRFPLSYICCSTFPLLLAQLVSQTRKQNTAVTFFIHLTVKISLHRARSTDTINGTVESNARYRIED